VYRQNKGTMYQMEQLHSYQLPLYDKVLKNSRSRDRQHRNHSHHHLYLHKYMSIVQLQNYIRHYWQYLSYRGFLQREKSYGEWLHKIHRAQHYIGHLFTVQEQQHKNKNTQHVLHQYQHFFDHYYSRYMILSYT